MWAALAFLVVPAIAGLATGRWQRPERAPRRRFWDGARAAGGAMVLYSGRPVSKLSWTVVADVPISACVPVSAIHMPIRISEEVTPGSAAAA